MARVTPAQREELKERGQWTDFCQYRDSLKEDGESPSNANRKALDRFLGDSTGYDGCGADASIPPEILQAIEELRAKDGSEIDTIRWVARNLEFPVPDIETCPDPAAWGLLQACKKSPAFSVEFWRSMYTKIIPSRSQLERRNTDDELDGMVQIETIHRIVDLGRKAVRQAQAEQESQESTE